MTLIESWLCGSLGQLRRLFPVRVIAIAEASCNLSCHHCYWAHDIHEPHVSDWDTQARQVATLGVPVFFAGRILTPRGMKLLNSCYGYGSKHFGIVDNGYTIFTAGEDWLRRFDDINISIDGAREAHEKQRAKVGSYDVAWNAVMRLKGMGLDPIVASAFSHMTFDGWDVFEALLADNDIRLSSTLIHVSSPVRVRGTALYKDAEMLRKAFATLAKGIPKIINIYSLENVRALIPIFKEMRWQPDTIDGDCFVSELENGVQVIYRPDSVKMLGEVSLRWDGKFYSPTTVSGESPSLDIDSLPDSYFEQAATLNKRELEVWSQII